MQERGGEQEATGGRSCADPRPSGFGLMPCIDERRTHDERRAPRQTRLIPFALLAAALLPAGVYSEPPKKRPTPCETVYPSDVTIEWDCRTIRPGEYLEKLFGVHWVQVARFNRIDRRHARPGVPIKVPKRLDDLSAFTPLPLSYPPAEEDEKFILLDLSEQYLGAYEYGMLRFALPVASGDRQDPTPSGEFRLTAAQRRRISSLYPSKWSAGSYHRPGAEWSE